MEKKGFQDYYADDMSHCYGCGRLNEVGFKLKSYWDGEESVCTFHPEPYHTSIPGFVYGGLISSLIDCHGTGTAAAAAHRAEGRVMGTEPKLRFVTASIHVDFVKPTPIDADLVLRGKVLEVKERKVVVEVSLSARGEICAKGKVIAVKIPENMIPGK
jgi:acyl-coenzyme A thioesterase PaaI-like protein